MPRYAALLAGINLGKRRLKMAALRELFEQLGFENVATLLASGNVIFASPRRSAAALERTIEQHLATELGYQVDTYIRTASEISAIASATPFGETATHDKSVSVQVMFFKGPIQKATAQQLSKIKTDRDRFAIIGRELYWHVTGRLSDSIVWKSPEMKAIDLPPGTTRNMNTIHKIAAQSARANDLDDRA